MEPQEDSPLVQNPRDAIRGNVMRTLLTVSENSKYYIWFKLSLSLVKIFICAFIILSYETDTDKPLEVFIIMIISTESVDVLTLFYFLLTEPNNRRESSRSLMSFIRNIGSLVYLVAQILGNIWYYTCDSCYDDAPEMTVLSLVLIILGYINFCVPCIACCCICISLPFLIIALAYSGGNQTPANEEAIKRLPVSKWKDSGVTECLICIQNFNENDDVIHLPCNESHCFHSACLKRWLRINNSCPICRKSIE